MVIQKQLIGKSVFVPLDGQQRLTTLFLLYWYSCIKPSNIEISEKTNALRILSRFRYQTRISSREFCELITMQIANKMESETEAKFCDEIKNTFSEETKISTFITNMDSFYYEWKEDATISAMLVMIDEIHKHFCNVDNLFERITKNQLIYFELLELKELGLEDDIYIKMNARGKQLTDFENFKANMEDDLKAILQKQYLNESEYLEKITELSKKMDNEWAEIFWQFKEEKIDENGHISYMYDQLYLAFIKNLMMNVLMQKSEEEEVQSLINEASNMLFYDNWKIAVNEKFLTSLENFLDNYEILKSEPILEIFNCVNFFKAASKGVLDYKEYVMLYAMSCFFNNIKCSRENVQSKFGDWIRVIRNLSENTIIDSSERYKAAENGINSISQYSNDIISALANEKIELTGFNPEQIKSEITKAKIISKDKTGKWSKLLYDIDINAYLRGMAGFLFKFSGFWDYEEKTENIELESEEGQKIYNIISRYFEITKVLFEDREFSEGKEKLLIRALLTKGNYLITQKSSYSFLVYEDRDISFRRLLSGRECETNREPFKELLRDLNNLAQTITKESIENALKDIINKSIAEFSDNAIIEYSFNSPGIWKKYFIKYPKLYGELSKSNMHIRIDERDVCNYLLETQTLKGAECCFEIYKLKLDLEELGYDVEIKKGRGGYRIPSQICRINDNTRISIIYDSERAYRKKEDRYVVRTGNENKEISSEEDMIKFIQELEK